MIKSIPRYSIGTLWGWRSYDTMLLAIVVNERNYHREILWLNTWDTSTVRTSELDKNFTKLDDK